MTKSEIQMTNEVRMTNAVGLSCEFAFLLVKIDDGSSWRHCSRRAFPEDHIIEPARDVFAHASFLPIAIPL
jgi:hypothetical protein